MAEKSSYPQIPSTVWWGVRSIFQRTPNVTIDDRYLGTHLDVQDAAARQYVAELKRVGILTEEGKATSVASRWKHDESYWSAVLEILASAYPDGLIQVAPPGEADRSKVISWFTRDGLGTGTANNKAATYMLIGSPNPNEAPSKVTSTEKKKSSPPLAQKSKPLKNIEKPSRNTQAKFEPMPLNINVQIHISADATSDQIESIFAAMRRYLYENPVS